MIPDELKTEERAEPTPQEIELRKDAEARKQWERNESGVDPCPGGDAP